MAAKKARALRLLLTEPDLLDGVDEDARRAVEEDLRVYYLATIPMDPHVREAQAIREPCSDIEYATRCQFLVPPGSPQRNEHNSSGAPDVPLVRRVVKVIPPSLLDSLLQGLDAQDGYRRLLHRFTTQDRREREKAWITRWHDAWRVRRFLVDDIAGLFRTLCPPADELERGLRRGAVHFVADDRRARKRIGQAAHERVDAMRAPSLAQYVRLTDMAGLTRGEAVDLVIATIDPSIWSRSPCPTFATELHAKTRPAAIKALGYRRRPK